MFIHSYTVVKGLEVFMVLSFQLFCMLKIFPIKGENNRSENSHLPPV